MDQQVSSANSTANVQGNLSGPGGMVLSAVIFGFFGFFMGPWNTTSVVTGQFLLYVAMFNWTLQVFAIVCLGCAAMTVVNAWLGNALYAGTGLVCAAMFVIIAIMDWLDPSTIMPYAPFLLCAFAAWNGYGSWMAIRELRAKRAIRAVPSGSGGETPFGSLPR